MAFGWLSALHPRSKQIIHRIEDLYGVRRAYIYRTWSKLTPERRAAIVGGDTFVSSTGTAAFRR